jgi:anti-sigma factor RsiW
MSCKRLRPKLDLYAGDDLDARDSLAVERHLRTCLSCYRDYVELRDVLMRVRATRPASPALPAGVAPITADVMGRIHGPPPPAPVLLERLTLASGWAAALVIGGVLGWRLLGNAAEVGEPGRPPRILELPSPGASPAGGILESLPTLGEDLDRQLEDLRARRGPSRSPRGVESPSPMTVPPPLRPRNF